MEWKKVRNNKQKAGTRTVNIKTFLNSKGELWDITTKSEGEACIVLAFTSKREIILTEEFRPGPEKVLLDLPGGAVEKGETPMDAVQREFLEESGYVGNFMYVGKSLDCPYSNLVRYNFIAINCYPVEGYQPEFNVHLVDLGTFRNLLRSGMMSDIESGYLCLDHLNLL